MTSQMTPLNTIRTMLIAGFFSQFCSCFWTLIQQDKQYHGGQFYQWGKLEYQEKTTDMIVVIDKLYNKMFYRLSLVMSGI
jgi:hypothetical protein